MFRGSVKSTGYPLHSPVPPSVPFRCVTVCHHISAALYQRKMEHWWNEELITRPQCVAVKDSSSFIYTRCGKKPMSKLRELIGWTKNKDLLSRNCMSEMRPWSTTDSQIGSDWGWKSSKNISHRHLQRSLDWACRTNGLASQATGLHTNGLLPIGAHYSPD